jgi:hypothetical protein
MKIRSLISCSLFSIVVNINAGSMGPVSTTFSSTMLPFVSIEGAYTWNSMYAGVINGIQSDLNNAPWGGRAAGGFALKHTENLLFSGEVGWGAYGTNRFSTTAGESAAYHFYGFDLLLGAIYSYRQFDFFAKAGAMIETLRGSATSNLSEFYPGGLFSGTILETSSQTTALPEIKVGGEYNFNNHFALSLAYMYAFGSNQSLHIDNHAVVGGGITLNQQLRFQAPSFNTIMLGLRYYI